MRNHLIANLTGSEGALKPGAEYDHRSVHSTASYSTPTSGLLEGWVKAGRLDGDCFPAAWESPPPSHFPSADQTVQQQVARGRADADCPIPVTEL